MCWPSILENYCLKYRARRPGTIHDRRPLRGVRKQVCFRTKSERDDFEIISSPLRLSAIVTRCPAVGQLGMHSSKAARLEPQRLPLAFKPCGFAGSHAKHFHLRVRNENNRIRRRAYNYKVKLHSAFSPIYCASLNVILCAESV